MKMSNDNTFILQLKVHSIVTSIKEYFNISYKEALRLLYHSKVYKSLEKEETKM